MSAPPEAPVVDTTPDDVEFTVWCVDHPDVVRLLHAFYDEQVGRYGFAESIALAGAEYQHPEGIFVVAYRHGTAVGCGGYRRYPATARTVEIKKLYLLPDERGRGVGRELLSWLEHHAHACGAERAILETGIRNTDALRLFTATGYQSVPRYVATRDPAINRAFAKPLEPPRKPDHG